MNNENFIQIPGYEKAKVQPIITLIKDGKPVALFADGTVDGNLDCGFMNGAMPLLDSIHFHCRESKAATQLQNQLLVQSQSDGNLADRILELLQCYGQRWKAQEESK